MNRLELTQEEIRRRVRELGDWFHNLDLGGIPTAPDPRCSSLLCSRSPVVRRARRPVPIPTWPPPST